MLSVLFAMILRTISLLSGILTVIGFLAEVVVLVVLFVVIVTVVMTDVRVVKGFPARKYDDCVVAMVVAMIE